MSVPRRTCSIVFTLRWVPGKNLLFGAPVWHDTPGDRGLNKVLIGANGLQFQHLKSYRMCTTVGSSAS